MPPEAAPSGVLEGGWDWAGYLDSLEVALIEVHAALAADRAPELAEFAQPTTAMPAALAPRCAHLLDGLRHATADLATRQDVVRRALTGLAHPRPRGPSASTGTVGEHLDLLG